MDKRDLGESSANCTTQVLNRSPTHTVHWCPDAFPDVISLVPPRCMDPFSVRYGPIPLPEAPAFLYRCGITRHAVWNLGARGVSCTCIRIASPFSLRLLVGECDDSDSASGGSCKWWRWQGELMRPIPTHLHLHDAVIIQALIVCLDCHKDSLHRASVYSLIHPVPSNCMMCLIYQSGLFTPRLNTTKCFVAGWMGGKLGKEWIPVFLWPGPITGQLKLS